MNRQRGAALLLAMIILTLVATVAAGMVWQQTRTVEVEGAERARLQSAWILAGAQDWARLILREDSRSGGPDHLGEPWATPLAEARLSTFLAADKDNNTEGGPEAFLSGSIVDAQSRYNLRNLVADDGTTAKAEVKAFASLCDAVGLPADLAGRIAEGMRSAQSALTEDGAPNAPLMPRRASQLTWLGLDEASVARLTPYVSILPVRTAVNVNTASREVLLAAIDGLDLGTAERLVQLRTKSPFSTPQALQAALPQGLQVDPQRVGVSSSYFDVYGRLRLEERVLEEHSLVQRRPGGGEVFTVQRDRQSLITATP